MTITDIKQQVKRLDRYSIFVDGKYSFSLSELGLLNSGLHTGQEINGEKLGELKNTSLQDKLYNAALNLIARRQRSEWEIRDFLKRKNSPAPLTNDILNKLSNNGYINDVDFARAWIENRRLLRPTSRRKLILELKQKRISEDIIKQALEDDDTDESTIIKELIARKRKISRYQDDTKLMQYLSRQGFNYSDIKAALNQEDF